MSFHTPQKKDSSGSFYDRIGGVKDSIESTVALRHSHKSGSKSKQSNNPYAFKNTGRIISKDYKMKVKTELCKSWLKDGTCSFGDNCAFAHGEHELQKKKHVASRYKTKMC